MESTTDDAAVKDNTESGKREAEKYAVQNSSDDPLSTVATRHTLVSAKALSADDFASSIQAHNSLLHNDLALSKEVESVKVQALAAIQASDLKRERQLGDLEQRMKQHDELRKEDRAKQEVFDQALINEKLPKHVEHTEKALSQIEETLNLQFKALAKTTEVLAQKQTEIESATLPKWHAELSLETQKLMTDLSRLHESTSERLNTLQSNLKAEQEARELAASKRMEWMAEELNELKSKLFQAEIQLGSTEKTLLERSSEFKKADDELAGRIKSQGDKFEALLETAVVAAKDSVIEMVSSRIKGLEDAFKQVDFERLQAQERLQQEIAIKVKELSTASEASFQKAETARANMKDELDSFRAQLSTKAPAAQVEESRSRLQKLEEGTNGLQKNIRSLDERLTSATETLQLELRNWQNSSQSTAKQLESKFDSARSEDSKEIASIKAAQQQSCEEHRQHASNMKTEIGEVRGELSAAKALMNNQENALASISQRMDPMSDMVRELVQDLETCSKSQQQIDGTMNQIKTQITDISEKMLPMADAQRRIRELEWYIEKTISMSFGGGMGSMFVAGKACQRGTSPNWEETLKSTSPSIHSSVGWSVKQPNTARPSSANSRRRGESLHSSSVHVVPPAVTGVSEVLRSSTANVMPPAGTGISAARFQRGSPSTASTTATSVA
mmetsp:Transcript_6668/g.10624  ORF Transcript_6668/g.10624 Transcript_6668/m.10624 type:complete len:676 (-) Transcript_6668:138-2165(-)